MQALIRVTKPMDVNKTPGIAGKNFNGDTVPLYSCHKCTTPAYIR